MSAPGPQEKGLFGDAKYDYDEVAQQREQTLESLDPPPFAQQLRPIVQSLRPVITQVPDETAEEIREEGEAVAEMPVDPEMVAALLVRTDALLSQALKVPPDEDGTLRTYPSKILDLEKRLKLATGASEVVAVSIELRRLEVDFKWDVLENVTRITETQQKAKDFRTMQLIPGIIALYTILMIIILLQSDEMYTLPLFQIPLSVLGAGLVGGVTAQYYRYRTVTPSRLTDNDVVWFFTKPPIAVLMAGLAYGVIQAGFYVFQGSGDPDITLWPLWVIAALVGFSDWFFDTFIVKAVGRITGEEDQRIVSELSTEQMATPEELRALELERALRANQGDTVARLLGRATRTVPAVGVVTNPVVEIPGSTETLPPDAVDAMPGVVENGIVLNPETDDNTGVAIDIDTSVIPPVDDDNDPTVAG